MPSTINEIEWMLIVELLLLVCAGIMWAVAYSFRRWRPEYSLFKFCNKFWVTMFEPHLAFDAIAPLNRKKRNVSISESDESPEPIDESMPTMMSRGKSPARDKSADRDASGGAKSEPEVVSTVSLNVRVIPGAQKDEVVGKYADGIKVRVTAPPEDGAANKAVLLLLAHTLNVKPYQLSLVTGHYQQNKVVKISGMTTGQLKERLGKLPGE